MALTLAADLGVPTTLDPAIELTITGTVPDAIEAGYLFRLEDEVLELKYFGKTEETILGGAATQTVDDRNVWYARRGVDTAIASHAATTAVKGVADALLVGTTEVVPAPPFPEAGGATDHGALTGLADDDHAAYATTGELTDGLALKATPAQVATAVSDHSADTTAVHGIADTANIPQSQVSGLVAALAALATVVTDTTTVTVDTTDTDATLTGGFPGAFEAGQVGWLVSGVGIPSGATIASVPGDGTTAEMSAPATATGNVEIRLTEPAPSPTFAGMLWRRGEGAAAAYSVRDAADADWIPLGPAYYNTDGRLHAFVGYDVAGGNLRAVHYGGLVPAEIVLQSDGTVVVGNFAGGIEISATGAIALTGTTFTFNGETVDTTP